LRCSLLRLLWASQAWRGLRPSRTALLFKSASVKRLRFNSRLSSLSANEAIRKARQALELIEFIRQEIEEEDEADILLMLMI
jgi:hypothetical protein